MNTIRIGNDISFVWKFFAKNGGARIPYNIEGKDVKVVILDHFGKEFVPELTMQGNAAFFSFYGKDQKVVGNYTLTLYENAGNVGMKVVDKITPFKLVSKQDTVISKGCSRECPTLDIITLELDSDLGQSGNYNDLTNKPSINGVMLTGDKSLSELGIESKHPYLSLERLRPFLYKVSFDSLPEDNGWDSPVAGGCSSYVQGGKLYRNLDFNYDNAASFIVKTRDFEGMSFVTGLNDGNMIGELIAQLPYRIVDGRNNHGIMVSTHVLFNDWNWTGCGDRSVNLTRLPFLVLSRVRSMATIEQDLAGVLDNLFASEGLLATGYLLQCLVTDGTTTYALLPPTNKGQSYVIEDITAHPKLTNFRWVAADIVDKADLQLRPTGVERFNMMPCALKDLRFTKAYESRDRLSEFIGERGTTKYSSDAELFAIYQEGRERYLNRERDGQTWHTMHSVVYGSKMESLSVQENWDDDCVGVHNGILSGYLLSGEFYEDEDHTTKLPRIQKIIYINLGTEYRDLYIFNGSRYLRVSDSSLTKEQADQLYAAKEHSHSIKDIKDIDFLSQQQIINILNS